MLKDSLLSVCDSEQRKYGVIQCSSWSSKRKALKNYIYGRITRISNKRRCENKVMLVQLYVTTRLLVCFVLWTLVCKQMSIITLFLAIK